MARLAFGIIVDIFHLRRLVVIVIFSEFSRAFAAYPHTYTQQDRCHGLMHYHTCGKYALKMTL